MFDKLVEVHDIGRTVICDAACGRDLTDSPEQGGILFGSKAYCPKCTERSMPGIVQFEELHHIKARCPEGMTFADWVRELRGGDNTIKVYTE